jgi:membrane protease subunit HflC
METYRKVINSDASIVLSTNSELFGLLKRVEKGD